MSDVRDWMALVVAAIVSLSGYLLICQFVGLPFAVMLMILVLVPLGMSIARFVTGRDLMAVFGFR